MNVILNNKWGQNTDNTWQNLSDHQWMCFRLALEDTITEVSVQGVKVLTDYPQFAAITEVIPTGVRVEHSSVIFSTLTDLIANIVISDRDYYSEMINYVPWYEQVSDEFKALLNCYDSEFRLAEQSLEVIVRNLFISTSIEGLHLLERDLGISGSGHLGYDQRREQISSRYIAAFDQTTEDTIKAVASAYSNGEVEVNKTDVLGLFEVKFVGTVGVPDNIKGLQEALDIIIPAHLGLTYSFIFNTWNMIGNRTWRNVSNISWNNLREVS